MTSFIIAAILGFSNPTPTPRMVVAEIERQAVVYGVDPVEAKQVAFCESSFRWNAKNPKSSATGVYQWTQGTWKYIGATGPRNNYQENIRQFMVHYPKHKSWWKDCLSKTYVKAN